jgi:hypothetical protein
MRTYKFLNQKYGLKSLYERRLRRTRINELNDPFELRPYDLADPIVRQAVFSTRDDISQRFGLLCFSAAWNNPMIWAHYSDKHRGLCLGFEIPSEVENARTQKVEYIPAPLPFPGDFLHLDTQEQLAIVNKMIYTKYDSWQYEQEIRTWTDLEEEYFDFCEMLQLVEVIIGSESQLSSRAVTRALGPLADRVKVKKARASYDAFQMVEAESSR